MTDQKIAKYKVLLILIVFSSTSFFTGTYYENNKNKNLVIDQIEAINSTSTNSIDLAPFWKTWETLNEKFVYTKKDAKKISDQDKLWGAIKGLTSSYGDPYTVFMPPVESKNFESDISGNFEGVGMELGMKDKNIVVVSPLKGTPAYNAGVKKGDFLLEIDGKSTAGLGIDDAVKLIRGKAGTEVALKLFRDSKKEPFVIKIMRAVIDIPTIDTETKDDVFIIRLYNFYAISPNKFREALREFVSSGKYKLVLDLRGNPGGYLEAAVDMASWFLPMGKVVVREDFGSNFEEQVYRSHGYNIFTDKLKMVILADEGSASASEILAGALTEQGIAKLVGTKTFGKGSVQEVVKITPETSLKVTVARWLTPDGISISENGLKPDYEVKFTEEDAKAGRDPQLDKAIEVLK